MSDLKISDRLLSWVLGCDCEFVIITELNEIMFSFDIVSKDVIQELATNKVIVVTCDWACYINLHTFIHLAKIEAFECGFKASEGGNCIAVAWITDNGKIKTTHFDRYQFSKESYRIEQVLEYLEWVAEKIGGER